MEASFDQLMGLKLLKQLLYQLYSDLPGLSAAFVLLKCKHAKHMRLIIRSYFRILLLAIILGRKKWFSTTYITTQESV